MTKEEQAQEALEAHPDSLVGAVKAVFDHPRAGQALVWLADVCCATESTINENPFLMAAAEGRRQVWVALNQVLALSQKDITALRQQVIDTKEDRHYV